MAVCFLWHYPAGCPGWLLTTTLLCGARTFLGKSDWARPKRLDATAWPTHPRGSAYLGHDLESDLARIQVSEGQFSSDPLPQLGVAIAIGQDHRVGHLDDEVIA